MKKITKATGLDVLQNPTDSKSVDELKGLELSQFDLTWEVWKKVANKK